MGKVKPGLVVHVSHRCTPDPAEVRRGLDLWAAHLARAVPYPVAWQQAGRGRGREAGTGS